MTSINSKSFEMGGGNSSDNKQRGSYDEEKNIL